MADRIAWSRLRKSGLVEPFTEPTAAATALVGVQAQVLRSAGLSMSARLPRPFTASALAGCLYTDRSLIKLWGQRRTLHLYTPEDWPLLYSVFKDRTTWAMMVTRKVGGDVAALAAGARDLACRLEEVDTLSRKIALTERPDLAPFLDLGIGLFMDVVQTGAACHVEPVGSESHFAHRTSWLPRLAWDPPGRDEAGVQLTRRYLAAYGPATVQDVAFWLGEKISDVRRWLDTLAKEVVAIAGGHPDPFLALPDDDTLEETPPSRARWPVRLLHCYDVLLLAHKDKSWLIDEEFYKSVWKTAGRVDAVVLVGGRVAGTWRYNLKKRSVGIEVTAFRRLSAAVRKQVAVEAERVAEHLEVELAGISYD